MIKNYTKPLKKMSNKEWLEYKKNFKPDIMIQGLRAGLI